MRLRRANELGFFFFFFFFFFKKLYFLLWPGSLFGMGPPNPHTPKERFWGGGCGFFVFVYIFFCPLKNSQTFPFFFFFFFCLEQIRLCTWLGYLFGMCLLNSPDPRERFWARCCSVAAFVYSIVCTLQYVQAFHFFFLFFATINFFSPIIFCRSSS